MALFGTISPDKPLTNRNLIINGAMQIAQRATSVTGIANEAYRTADRWNLDILTCGTWTMNVESSGPTDTEFSSSANIICTTADTSPTSGDRLEIQQRIEGLNLQGIKKGTANAESITVSFWAKSSNTGTYICELTDDTNNRQISKTYTISSANTWEKKTITFPPDTTGKITNDNTTGLTLFLWFAAGSVYTSGTLNSSAWATQVAANRVVGQVNLANRVGNYFAFTGVQMEIGTVATPYEWRNYGQELALCQRYFYKSGAYDIGLANPSSTGYSFRQTSQERISLPVTMRTGPSCTAIVASDGLTGGVTIDTREGKTIAVVPANYTTMLAAPSGAYWYGGFTASAEL
jgi:hypothetical protein